MTTSTFFYSSIYSDCPINSYSIYLPPSFYIVIYSKRRKHLKKQDTFNKQYERKMTTDKRFRQNHTKYLRFKAFRQKTR